MKTYEERTHGVLEKANKQKHTRTVKRTSIISCSLAVLLGLNLFLFVPYQTGGYDTSAFKDSEYYSIIQKISGVTYGLPETKSNFTRLMESLPSLKTGDMASDEWVMSPGVAIPDGVDRPNAVPPTASDPSDSDHSGTSSSNGNYEEVTNNQTRGVTEGDLFKRSSEYIFYLNVPYHDYIYNTLGCTYTIEVYSIEGIQSQSVASYTVESDEAVRYGSAPEIFLSKDCNTITLIAPCIKNTTYQYYPQYYTALIALDVSDVTDIKEINRTYISGNYLSSRMTDDSFLLISNFTVKGKPDFSDEEQFIPRTGSDFENMQSLPVDDIIVPDSISNATYTLVCSFNKDMEMTDTEAFLSYSRDIYASRENLYVMRQFETDTENGYQLKFSYPETEIYCVGYGAEGLDIKGSFNVKGTILNRYCMDEYEGVLRVFTNLRDSRRNNTCNLYCVDLNSFETIASVEDFAPANETIRSARFDGKTGYACTAITYEIYTCDPVYAFNLSDYNNITSTDTGTIAGFSSSLTKFSGDTLLGIGQGEWFGSLKIELYRETGTEVISVASFELDDANYSSDYKAYFIDAEHGLIGLGVNYYDRDLNAYKHKNSYIILYYDGFELKKIAELEKEGSFHYDRATYIDNCIYILGEDYFKVIEDYCNV